MGNASIKITANTVGLRPHIRSELTKLRGPVSSIGDDLGTRFARSFNKAVERNLGNTSAFKQMGKDAASAFNEGMNAELARGGREGGRAHVKAFDREITTGVAKSVSRSVRDAESVGVAQSRTSGSRMGSAFSRGFSDTAGSNFAKTARAAADSFTVLYARTGALYGVMSSMAGALSSVASGLFLVGTAAGSAAASLSGVIGFAGAAAQGGIALGVAFKGVFSTISAGAKQSQATTRAAGDSGVDSARRIADAQRALDKVRMQNQDRIQAATQKVRDAHDDLTRALQTQRIAQDALTRARRDAREELEQLQFDAEDAALAQDRAALSLEEAKNRLDQAQFLPAGSFDRRDAELAFKEAELNYRTAADRADDLAKAQEEAARKGIEGTKAYGDAQNDLIKAQEDVADAERGIAEARADKARAQRDAAIALADAQRAVNRAMQDANKQTSSSAAATDAYAEAMSKLSGSAQEFVRYLLSMSDRFNAFKKAVQEPFFANFNSSFFEAVNTLLPVFENGLKRTSGIMGTLGAQLAGGMTRNAGLFRDTMAQNNRVLEIFTERGDNGRSVMDDLVTVMLRLWTALEPITTRFARLITRMTEAAEAATDTKKEMQGITQFLNRASDRASVFGDIFKSIFSTFKNLAKAAQPAVDELLDYFKRAFNGMDIASGNSMKKNRKFFKDVVDNLKPMLDLVGQLVMAFLRLGDNKDIGDTFKRLQDAVPFLETFMENGAALGPILADIVVEITRIMAALSQGEGEGKSALSSMLEVFHQVAIAFRVIAENPAFQAIFMTVGPALGILKAISLLSMGFGKAGEILLGYAFKVNGVLRGAGRVLGGALSKLPGRAGAVGRGIAPSKAGSSKIDKAYENSKMSIGEKAIVAAVGKVEAAVRQTMLGGGAAGKAGKSGGVAASRTQMGGKSVSVTQNKAASAIKPSATGAYVMPDMSGKMDKNTKSAGKLSKVFGGLGKGLKFLGGAFGIVLMVLPLLLPMIEKLWNENEGFRNSVMKIMDVFNKLFDALSKAILPILQELVDALAPVIQQFAEEMAPIMDEMVTMFTTEFLPLFQEIAQVLGEVLPPVISFVVNAIKIWMKAMMEVYKFIVPLLIPVIRFLVRLLGVILIAAIKALSATFRFLWNAVKRYWENIGKPVFDMLRRVIKAVSKFIGNRIDDIKGFFRGLWDTIRDVFDKHIQPKFNAFKDWIVSLKDSVKKPIEAIGGFFSGIYDNIKNAIDKVPNLINDYIIGPINKVLDFLGLKEIPTITVSGSSGSSGKAKKKAHGGLVGGNGGPTSDDQPHYLSTGEYVVRASSVRKYGQSTFDALNHGTVRGGVKDWISDKFDSLKSLAKSGAAGAISKIINSGIGSVIQKFGGAIGLKPIIEGLIKMIGDGASRFGKREEQRAAAEAASTGSIRFVPYRGPNGGWWYPVADRTPSSYSGHKGNWGTGSADFGLPTGAPVYAASSGRVSLAGWSGWAGNTVVISHAHRQSQYAHLSKILVSRGDIVETGQKIGLVGSTGNSSGPHLHFDISGQPGGWLGVWDLLKRLIASNPKKLAKGGVVPATPGGILSLIGEGGRAERVEPLDPQGLSVRDRAIIEHLARTQGGGGGNVVVRVYIGDRELRDIVDYEIVTHENHVARKLAGGRRVR